MAMLRRATIASDLVEEVGSWISAMVTYADPNGWDYKRFMRDSDKLSKADPFAGNLTKAMVHHMSGDLDGSLYWLRNASNWMNRQSELTHTEVVILSNLGYFSEAASRLPLLVAAGRGPDMSLTFGRLGMLCGTPEVSLALFSELPADRTDGPELANLARRCSMALSNLKADPKKLQAVLDIAGAVLREHHMFFAGEDAVVRASHDGLLYQLPIAADVETASGMTDEVIVRMIESDLDQSGIAFSFITV